MQQPAQQQHKLDVFVQSIMEESTAEVGDILQQMETRHKEAIDAARASLTLEAARYKAAKISEIHARENRRVNARMTENKQKLLLFREECANENFRRVQERLKVFMEDPKYVEHLTHLLKRATRLLAAGGSADVYLRPEDMRFADTLMESAPDYTLAFHPGHLHLGGLQLVSHERGMRVDMSFDSALNDLIGHFAEISGMNIG